MTIDHDDRCQALDEALTKLQEVHELLDAAGLLDDQQFAAYHRASLEGESHGWLGGPFLIDAVREAFDAAERGDDESDEHEWNVDALDEPLGRCDNGKPIDVQTGECECETFEHGAVAR